MDIVEESVVRDGFEMREDGFDNDLNATFLRRAFLIALCLEEHGRKEGRKRVFFAAGR